jgi:hypothetical protein
MKWTFGLIILISLFFFQDSFGQEASPWNGTFTGSILGTHAVLTGNLQGTLWMGSIQVEKNPFQPPNTLGANISEETYIQLEGTVNGEECTGNMRDQHSQKSSYFSATGTGNQITIKVHELNPLTGFEEDMNLYFSRNVPVTAPQTKSTTIEMQDGTLLDETLLGLWWLATEELNRGFITTTDYYIQFFTNGVMLITDGRNGELDFPVSLKPDDPDTHSLNWKIEKQLIWTQDASGQWQPYARYREEGGTLLLVYSNGKKEVWERL